MTVTGTRFDQAVHKKRKEVKYMPEDKDRDKKPQRTQIMTLKEVAKYLGVHSMTVYRLLKEKKLPGFKVGGQWRTKKEVLDNYLLREVEKTGVQEIKKK